jgi:hypothetical protein
MAALVSDEVVQAFTAAAPYDGLAAAIAARFGELTDGVELGLLDDVPAEAARDVLADLRRIPAAFAGPAAA